MKRYEQYKDSGVAWIGEIPAHWKVCKTKYVANLYTGNSLNDSQKEEYTIPSSDMTLPYVATKDIAAEKDAINYSNGINIPKTSLLKVAPANTFLLCVEGGSAGRKIAYNTTPAYFVNKLCCFESKINPRYHYYFVKSHGFANIFKQSIQGLIGGVSVSTLNNLEIAIPSLEEQNAIVRYLDYKVAKIDQLIAESEVQIEELGKYKTAMISEVVTKGLNPDAPMRDSGIEWIGQIPEHWAVKKLKQKSIFINGFAFDSADFTTAEGVRVIRIGDIGFKVDFEGCTRATTASSTLAPYRVKNGDILIAMSGATTGKCCIVDEAKEAYINQRVGIIRSNIYKVIYYYLQTPYFMEFVNLNNSGTAQPNISSKAIGEFPILDTSLAEQNAIVDYLDKKCADIDSAIKLLNDYVEQLKVYKTALISEAVTGQIDVRDWQEKSSSNSN